MAHVRERKVDRAIENAEERVPESLNTFKWFRPSTGRKSLIARQYPKLRRHGTDAANTAEGETTDLHRGERLKTRRFTSQAKAL